MARFERQAYLWIPLNQAKVLKLFARRFSFKDTFTNENIFIFKRQSVCPNKSVCPNNSLSVRTSFICLLFYILGISGLHYPKGEQRGRRSRPICEFQLIFFSKLKLYGLYRNVDHVIIRHRVHYILFCKVNFAADVLC